MDRRVYLEAKFGGPGELKAIQDRVAAVGTSTGIDFAFDRIKRTPNTFDAHRVIRFARQQAHQDEVVEELFRGDLTEGLNIGGAEVLILSQRAPDWTVTRSAGCYKARMVSTPCDRKRRADIS